MSHGPPLVPGCSGAWDSGAQGAQLGDRTPWVSVSLGPSLAPCLKSSWKFGRSYAPYPPRCPIHKRTPGARAVTYREVESVGGNEGQMTSRGWEQAARTGVSEETPETSLPLSLCAWRRDRLGHGRSRRPQAGKRPHQEATLSTPGPWTPAPRAVRSPICYCSPGSLSFSSGFCADS